MLRGRARAQAQQSGPGLAPSMESQTSQCVGMLVGSRHVLPCSQTACGSTGFQSQDNSVQSSTDGSAHVSEGIGGVQIQRSMQTLAEGSGMPAQTEAQGGSSETDAMSEARQPVVGGQRLPTLSKPLGKTAKRRRRRQRAAMASSQAPRDLGDTKDQAPESGCTDMANAEDQEASVAEAEARHARAIAHEMMDMLAADDNRRESAIDQFRELAFSDKPSSRAAQLLLEESCAKDARDLAFSLRGYVHAATRSMYANYVVQRLVEVLPASASGFVAEELLNSGAEVARHRFGCRVLCRLLEHSTCSELAAARLFDEVLDDAEALCRHGFGSFVMGHFLEFGTLEHRRRVVAALRTRTLDMATDRRGSRIVEAALRQCLPDEQRALAEDIFAYPEQFVTMAQHQCGVHVVRSLLWMPGYRQRAASLLRPAAAQLQVSKYGKQLLPIFDSSTV